MAKKIDKPESSSVKAFKAKWGNAKKAFPSEEERMLQEAEERTSNPAISKNEKKKLSEVTKAKDVIVDTDTPIDTERVKLIAEANDILFPKTEEAPKAAKPKKKKKKGK